MTIGVDYSNDFFDESGTGIRPYVDYSLSLPNEFGLDFHYGHQSIDDNDTFGAPDYSEYSIGLTKSAVDILKTKEEHVIVVFEDNPKENWFLAGKQL